LRAQQHFERSLTIDPDFATAWVALAATYNLRRGDPSVPDEDVMPAEMAVPLMREALGKALDLDPGNPEALLRMSRFAEREGDNERALDQMEQAMRSGRNVALVQALLGGLAFKNGDPVTGAELLRRAATLDPLNATHLKNLGSFTYAAGRLDEADHAYGRAEELNPESAADNRGSRVWIAIHQQDYAAAAELAAQLPPGPERDQADALLAFQAGDIDAANAALERLLQSPAESAAARLACVFAFRGDTDQAFRWIERATMYLLSLDELTATQNFFTEFSASPFLQPLHGDPRWRSWLDETRQRLYRKENERIAEMLQRYVGESAGV
jgi:Tfp pilus assembly protein PilF